MGSCGPLNGRCESINQNVQKFHPNWYSDWEAGELGDESIAKPENRAENPKNKNLALRQNARVLRSGAYVDNM
jgi:hypothetical protein